MRLLALFLVVYVSPGCLSQCVNCAPQPTYQYVLQVPSNYLQVPSNRAPCCVPTSNVQTIQTARAFTNGAQGSQVIMYYNGQRVVSGSQPQQQGSNFNQANNYQNPGPIPGYQTGYDPNQNQNQNQTGYYPNNLNGGVVAGGATTGTVVIGGVTQQQGGINAGGNVGGQNQNINAGGNFGNQNQNQNQDPNFNVGGNVQNQGQFQNNDPYQNQNQNQPNYNTGGVIGNQNQNQAQYQGPDGQFQYQNQDQSGGYIDNQGQYQNQNMNVDNQNQGQFQDQNQGQFQGSTLSPSGGEVGYQPFVPSGNTDYNNGAVGQLDQQGQQPGQQGQFQQNQNDQQVIYPAGGIATGGAVGGSSYNSPNSGYVNSQVQPQTYPTQTVTGGAINNQNVQQQPDMNAQYQDQMNQQNMGNPQGNNNFQDGNVNQQQGGFQQGGAQGGVFVGSTTPQGQQFTTAPNQGQQFTNDPNQQFTQGQQFTNTPNNQFQQTTPGPQFTNQGFTSTPGYQQGDFLTEGSGNEENEFLGGQQQFITSPNQQQQFQDGQQGYTDNTLTPPIENVQNDNSQFTQASSPTPFPVIYPVSGESQSQPPQQFQQTPQAFETTTPFPGTTQTPYPVIYPVPSAGQGTPTQTSTVSSNPDEFGASSQFPNDATTSSQQTPIFVPVPVPQNDNNGNVPLETSTTSTTTTYVPIQNDIGTMPVTGTTQYNGGVQGNSFQSTTPTTTTNFNNGQSSTGFQSTTGMPVTNDNNFNNGQAGFQASTMDPNMPQAQYPSQQEILAATGQQADQSAISVSTPAPQFPSQQELGATVNQGNQPTPFPAQQQMGGVTNNQGIQQQDGSTQQAQFPSQQELLQRDQANSGGTGGTVNDSGFTPQYGDMNTPYGRYASTTAVKASSNPQFDQPTADQQAPQNSAGTSIKILFTTLLMIFLW